MGYKKLYKKLFEIADRVDNLEKIVKGEKLKDKITLQEFWDSNKRLAIHCKTEQQRDKLMQAFDKMGKVWENGERYVEWQTEDDVDFVVYYNNHTFGSKNFCYAKIYEFEDVILPEEPKWTFTEDEKVILKNLPAEIKWIARDEYGNIYVFALKPMKENNLHVWTVGLWGTFQNLNCYNHLFQTIKWQDTEPCEFRKYI